ncbi:Glycerol-3-phosphate acyltransferase 1 [Ananas comosus]|uniref:Glycerol-3-phosphate acyltransferase 1 n=1 Tax=Ananas comosus TaxID=4615 RepID=A0A199VZU0_ANACO|nr:Glycerol-3-phosphate acyltransferase 1 [Ananas comosus]
MQATADLFSVLSCVQSHTLVCDFHGALLRSTSPFPFFMLVAFEGGGLLRALLLLLCFPLVWALGQNGELGLRLMAFVTFFGLRRKDMELFYLENLHLHGYEVVVTSMPRVMVEGFLEEYLHVDRVVAPELHVLRALKSFSEKQKQMWSREPSNPHDHLFLSHSKEGYVVNNDDDAVLPREKYPKPVPPTPFAMTALLVFLPLGLTLSFIRIMLGVVPYKFSYMIGAATRKSMVGAAAAGSKGAAFVLTHRTLLDPVMLSVALQRPVPAVTYSLSRVSELISPVRTVRLTRDRARDAETMRRLLAEGDLAVCPEGTTCREPYLLRFSPLFAELADAVEPAAVDARGGWLYGTTASGHKWLDPVVFLMNPAPAYRIAFLGRLPTEMTRAGGWTAAEVANRVQRQLADALGFECTGLTRRDKYLILAGNEGQVVYFP